MITRDEFINRWVAAMRQRSGGIEAVPDGAILDGDHFFALPCACGANGCKGWAMVPSILVATHMEFCAPR